MKSLTWVSLGLLTSYVVAHPAPGAYQASEARLVGRAAVDVSRYYTTLQSVFKQASDAPQSILSLKAADYIGAATNLVKATFPLATFRVVDDHHVSNIGVGHVNFKQTVLGQDIDNADFHVNVDNSNLKILSYGHTFFAGTIPTTGLTKRAGLATPLNALQSAVRILGLPISINNASPQGSGSSFTFANVGGVASVPKADLVWVQKPGVNTLTPAWRIETDLGADWLTSYINAADTTQILSVANWANYESYVVYPFGVANPPLAPNGRTTLTNPQDQRAGPPNGINGWQNDATHHYTNTIGNNVIASPNPTGNDSYYLSATDRPQSTNGLFNFYYNTGDANYKDYTAASTVQLFYMNNKLHDLLYVLGFDEASGNFQYDNFGRGGLQRDNVIAYTQDGAGLNNAFMRTPADGQNPQMSMFMFSKSNPYRDSSFDADIVIHEYMHGLSNRLTGGPNNPNCLQTLEARGMGEGWSDFYAYASRLNTSDTLQSNVPDADWTYNNPKGARTYLYSNSQVTNPYTYASLNNLDEEHDFGEVWATILYGVYWNLVDGYGNTPADQPIAFYSDLTTFPKGGRFAAWKLVLDGMKLQPCNPTFIQARDAIIQADAKATNGYNYCRLWDAFSSRGLGSGAGVNKAGKYVNNFDVPASCGSE